MGGNAIGWVVIYTFPSESAGMKILFFVLVLSAGVTAGFLIIFSGICVLGTVIVVPLMLLCVAIWPFCVLAQKVIDNKRQVKCLRVPIPGARERQP